MFASHCMEYNKVEKFTFFFKSLIKYTSNFTLNFTLPNSIQYKWDDQPKCYQIYVGCIEIEPNLCGIR